MAQTRFSGPVKSDNGFIFGTSPEAEAVRIGEAVWSTSNGTLELALEYGVVLQIGQETYARVQNTTGSTIPKGTVVGFAGVGASRTLLVVPYIANGTSPSLYILGVMAHDLPDSGQLGYCTVFGHIRGVNTSSFDLGDVLYASPSSAGGFTKTKPTAPNLSIPVAAVLAKSATDGEIFVRPTVEQQKYYGVFSCNGLTISPSAIYTPKAVVLDTTNVSNGVALGTPTSRVVVANSGLYKFDFSIQLESSSASSKKVWIWPRVNGNDVPDSNGEVTVSGAGTVLIPSWSWTLSMNAGHYFELVFASDSVDILIVSKAATTGANGTATFARPAVPGVILDVVQIQQ